MKYHDESINVSIVSVSRLAGLPQLGHLNSVYSAVCLPHELHTFPTDASMISLRMIVIFINKLI